VAGLSLKRLQETHPVEFYWHAFELRPVGAPRMSDEHRMRIEAGRPVFAARVKRDYGIELHEGPFGINTHPLHQLKKFADAQDKGNEFHEAALDAYWMRGLDVSDAAVQQEILKRVGIETPVAEIMAQPEYQKQVLDDERIAYENGMNGVPALVFGEKYLVMGAQPLDVLKNVTEQVQQEMNAPDAEGAT
jgi:predicted DsbA family dithiol-disulfide isomerase